MADGCLTVTDVYEHAALIGKDIECMVNQYGEKVIEQIMPKIVFVLEQLEDLAEKCASDQQRIKELMVERESLIIHTKRDEAIQRQLEEKLIYTDGLLSRDKKGLLEKIKNLKQENEVLCEELDRRDNELVTLKTQGALPGDVEVMLRMKQTIDDQRDQIRSLNSQLLAQKEDIEALHEHTITMSDINEKLRSDQLIMTSKLKTSDGTIECTDNTGVNTSAQSSKHETSLQDELMGMDYSMDSQEIQSTDNEHMQSEEQGCNSVTTSEECSSATASPPNTDTAVASSSSSPSGKDPNRPRYTLMEMKKLIEERNLYKIRMIAYEEELELYKNNDSVKLGSSHEIESSYDDQRRPGGVRNLMQKFLGR